MLNGITGAAAAVCCGMPGPGLNAPGVNAPGGTVSIGGVQVPRTGAGWLQTVGQALDKAIHGGDSGGAGGAGGAGAGGASGYIGANPIPFPMVNPFKPVVKTRSPVTSLNAWPRRFTYRVKSEGSEPDDEQSSYSGLSGLSGSFDEILGPPPTMIYRPSSPSKLQTVLTTIEQTLPATIQALRANPQNIYPYNPYNTGGSVYPGQVGYQGNAGADIGSQAGAAVGNVGDTVGSIIARHPYLTLAAVGGAILLFMNPPRRR